MKVFLAGEFQLKPTPHYYRLFAGVMKYRLMSYAYHGMKDNRLTRDVMETLDMGAEVMLDSGAFTAHQKGIEISIEKYAAFMRKYDDKFSVKANLDVIGDGDGSASWRNLKILEGLGTRPFPVFHYGDNMQYLTKMLDEGYEFIALGGLVGASRNKLVEWLDRVWARYLVNSDGTPKLRVHGFGLTDQVLMVRYPWAQVDSASWIFAGTYGDGLFCKDGKLVKVGFSEISPERRKLNAWHYDTMAPALRKRVDEMLESIGVTAEECRKDHTPRFICCANAYTDLGKFNVKTFKAEQETFF